MAEIIALFVFAVVLAFLLGLIDHLLALRGCHHEPIFLV